MDSPHATADFLSALQHSLAETRFVALALKNYCGLQPGLKSIELRRILVKRQEKLSFTYHYQTRDEVKNYALAESLAILQALLDDGFRQARLQTTTADYHLQKSKTGEWALEQRAPSIASLPSADHDRRKKRPLAARGQSYLHVLGLADAHGKVLPSAQDKFRQINKYIEILEGLLTQLPPHETLRIVDMGAGKGYLTFALYDYLANHNRPAAITGVELRPDLVATCNAIARDAGFTGLRFIEGSITSYDCTGAHIVIALHACDTATDDALFKAIEAKAELIVVAPCCHKQIRREMEKSNQPTPLDFMTRFGTLRERQAEMITDALRAQLLEYAGYKTNLFEFISDAHTPKNVMITALKSGTPHPSILPAIAREKAFFGIAHHHLERLLGLAKP